VGNDNLQAPVQSDLPRGIGQPAIRALLLVDIRSLQDLAGLSAKELLAMHGIGPKAIRVIQVELKAAGLTLLVD